ncbi:tRNAHis guanylyltransferase [Patellaria atrata CBS 101060]|uniref:tRNA(His) guanylyltransferase n=1 Tax=Patellaria atrata CBS 101060 TaxID=1346257 RepID=A0A9P4VT93_9PEZI|nr:tRNAHis guanylyltransferase [Patellaria atrata CBS 101060]
MANSKYEYVRFFEQPDNLLPNTWIVVRIDGRSFTKFAKKYNFGKPNDRRALDLMNESAKSVMKELPDIVVAYGVSDEYSFVFHKSCTLFERRKSKLVSTIVSTFSAYYIHHWLSFFPSSPLEPPLPTFDGRAVVYPSLQNLRDYMSWRQVDCHVNNLYNTTFWALIKKGGLDNEDAERELAGTLAKDKNEILFSRFGINYNNEPEIFRKGSVVFRSYPTPTPPPKSTAESLTPSSLLATVLADLNLPNFPNNPSFNTKSSAPPPPTSRDFPPACPAPLEPTEKQGDIPGAPAPSTSPSAPIPSVAGVEGNEHEAETPAPSKTAAQKDLKRRQRARIVVEHVDIIGSAFWEERAWILTGRTP